MTIPAGHQSGLLALSRPFSPALPPPPPVEMPRIDDIIMTHGVQENANGGIFIPGATYGYKKKLEVAVAYHCGLEQDPPATIVNIAWEYKVS
jgi:hypothetical protein